jgi:hypothetical protein
METLQSTQAAPPQPKMVMRTDKPKQIAQDSFFTEESLAQEEGAEVDASPMLVVL